MKFPPIQLFQQECVQRGEKKFIQQFRMTADGRNFEVSHSFIFARPCIIFIFVFHERVEIVSSLLFSLLFPAEQTSYAAESTQKPHWKNEKPHIFNER